MSPGLIFPFKNLLLRLILWLLREVLDVIEPQVPEDEEKSPQ